MNFDIANLSIVDDFLQCGMLALIVIAAVLRAAKKRQLAIDLLYFSVACAVAYFARNW